MPMGEARSPSHRLDKWLWCARITRSRTGAQALIAAGQVRVNRARITRVSHELKIDDILTIIIGSRVRVMKVAGFAMRRGPAVAARMLYEDMREADAASPEIRAE